MLSTCCCCAVHSPCDGLHRPREGCHRRVSKGAFARSLFLGGGGLELVEGPAPANRPPPRAPRAGPLRAPSADPSGRTEGACRGPRAAPLKSRRAKYSRVGQIYCQIKKLIFLKNGEGRGGARNGSFHSLGVICKQTRLGAHAHMHMTCTQCHAHITHMHACAQTRTQCTHARTNTHNAM